VCLYVLSVISRCLRLANKDVTPDKKLRESIDFNTYKKKEFDTLKSPYDAMAFGKIRTIAARYVRKYTKAIEGAAGEGRAEQIAAIVESADMKTLTDGNTMGSLVAAINSENDDALEDIGRELYSNVVRGIHKTIDRGNPDDQM
jgi:hypothetical protein